MNTKLTLTIDKSIIESAKKYARNKERSLSDLIENYLKALVNTESEKKDQ
jgi:predicted HicB family RNase H-like nuclease